MCMSIINWDTLSPDEQESTLKRPVICNLDDQKNTVIEIFQNIKSNGDDALRQYTLLYDNIEIDNFMMTDDEINKAVNRTSDVLKDSINNAILNIKKFHEYTMGLEKDPIDINPGVQCQTIYRPIDSVGLYIPAGNNPLPSTVTMLGVPSILAGNKERIVVSPPNEEGLVNDVIVTAAALCGIDKIYKVGGAQSIAAMAYGTETIPKVDKIFGPGNSWVTTAKQLISTLNIPVAIDMPAGPTEVLIISDGYTDPIFVAFDLLSQAEHGIDSQVILLSDDKGFLDKVRIEINNALEFISTRETAEKSLKNSKFIYVKDIKCAFNISNNYSPEHLIVSMKSAERWLDVIESAGSIFLGEWSPESAGDYCSGTNHVLPTSGFANSYSGLSVDSFRKAISVQKLSEEGLRLMSNDIINLARAEGLEAHARAVEVRMDK
ncbi:MAG TPA: histidinol dehydrogenase [Gammaproteobacteria bacterium]|nr:histidinol dehydrogenase [Gammaproteobacteria bacterium]HIK77712.1 histidinol dehydrogenase [Gammaproteobacteria bacterium]